MDVLLLRYLFFQCITAVCSRVKSMTHHLYSHGCVAKQTLHKLNCPYSLLPQFLEHCLIPVVRLATAHHCFCWEGCAVAWA